jgi:hypothetical protein
MTIGKYAPYLSVDFVVSAENILMDEFLMKLKAGQNNFGDTEIIRYYSHLKKRR